MKKNAIIITLSVLVIINLMLNILDRKPTKKVAYVKSQELIYAFNGMKEMQLKFQEKSKEWDANIDTLRMEYQKSLSHYQQIINDLTVEEKMIQENLLRVQQNNLIQYSDNIKKMSKEDEDKMLGAVLNQVNGLIEVYGKKNNYELIFGTTLSGNILYGNDAIDITEELIIEINKSYEGI